MLPSHGKVRYLIRFGVWGHSPIPVSGPLLSTACGDQTNSSVRSSLCSSQLFLESKKFSGSNLEVLSFRLLAPVLLWIFMHTTCINNKRVVRIIWDKRKSWGFGKEKE